MKTLFEENEIMLFAYADTSFQTFEYDKNLKNKSIQVKIHLFKHLSELLQLRKKVIDKQLYTFTAIIDIKI